MQRDEGYAQINDAELHYEIAGAGPNLVLLHGFTLDMRMWDAQFKLLSQHFRVLRCDLRGFGQSSLPAAPYTHADDVAALMTTLGMTRAGVIGLSMGGAIALDFACLHPDRLQALVLVDAALGGFDRWTVHISFNAKERGMAQTKRDWLASPLLAPAMANPKSAPLLQRIVDDYSGWHFLHKDFDVFPPPTVIHRLATIHAPALVIVGEHDTVDFHNIADVLVSDIAGAKKVVMPRVGHMCNMEDPEAFNAVVLDFLLRHATTPQ